MSGGRVYSQCHNCGHVWQPRGGDVTRKCPDCGSSATGPFRGVDQRRAQPSEVTLRETAADVRGRRRGVAGCLALGCLLAVAVPFVGGVGWFLLREGVEIPEIPGLEGEGEGAPATTEPAPGDAVIASESGALLPDGAYLVRGRVRNEGGETVRGIVVRVRLHIGEETIEREADAPDELAPGEEARFELRYDGDGADAVSSFEVRASAR